MKRIAVAAVLVTLAFLSACGDDSPSGTGSTPTPSESPPPTTASFTEPEFEITLPIAWTREDATASVDAKKAVRFKDTDGDYVIVALDPLGSDFAADEVWRYQIKDAGFEVVEKTKCTSGDQCSTTDQRYDVYVLWKSGTNPEKVGGHSWYFIIGNAMKTTIDESLFEEIVESIRVTV